MLIEIGALMHLKAQEVWWLRRVNTSICRKED